MMGRPCILRLLLVTVLLLLSFSHGFGRQLMETAEFEESTVDIQEAEDEIGAEPREMIEVMDYKETGPNTNPRAGYNFSPPPQG